jgi:outer membrane protein TolC
MKPSIAEARKVLALEKQTDQIAEVLEKIDKLFLRMDALEKKLDALQSAKKPASKTD